MRTLLLVRWSAIVLATASLGTVAQAAVDVGPDRIVVTGPGARAVIERAPLRIAFTDPTGQTVLQQMPNGRSAAQPLPLTFDPEPMGVDPLPETAYYAPLFFEVGEALNLQWKSEFWAGNMMIGRRSGTVHFAWDAVGVTVVGEGVLLDVSTSDPTGRRLQVEVRPDHPGTIRVVVTPSSPDGVIGIGDAFASGPDEAFHGLGGRHVGVDLRGYEPYSWVEQENLGNIEAQIPLGPVFVAAGTPVPLADLGYPEALLQNPSAPFGGFEHFMYPNGPTAAYYPQNLFVSSRPYGFFADRMELTRWRFAVDRPDAWQLTVAAPALDYTVAVGAAPAVIDALTAINGRHRRPPRWSQGAAVWRAVQIFGADTVETYTAKIRQDLANIERLRPPLKAYAFEGWPLLDPAFVRDTVRRLRRRGIRTILYVRAFVADNDGVLSEPANAYAEAVALGLVTRRADGTPYVAKLGGFGVNADAALLDFTNPDTAVWWEDRLLRPMLEFGADGFMQDFGEEVMADMHFANGETGVTMHNRYPTVYHRVTREILDRLQREYRRGEIFVMTRAGFSGRPGSAAYESSNFPGDETTDWRAGSGLRSIIPDMLNRAIGGAYGYNTDIGGYSDFIAGPPSKELFVRWMQVAALTPFFRVHNSGIQGSRLPWSYDDETYALWVRFAGLHDRATKLVRKLWRKALATGMPPTRPLWLDYPDDPLAAAQSQQFLLGPDVLVAPVVEEGAVTRDVYFPAGCWYHPETAEQFAGPGTVTVAAPLARLPYFFRCGTRAFRPPR